VYLSLPYFTVQLFLVSGDIALAKVVIFIKWMEIHFVIKNVQFRGRVYKDLYQNELEVGLLPTPRFHQL